MSVSLAESEAKLAAVLAASGSLLLYQTEDIWPEENLGSDGPGLRHTRIGERLSTVRVCTQDDGTRRPQIEESYTILRKLGWGAYASTWLCQPALGKAISVQELRVNVANIRNVRLTLISGNRLLLSKFRAISTAKVHVASTHKSYKYYAMYEQPELPRRVREPRR